MNGWGIVDLAFWRVERDESMAEVLESGQVEIPESVVAAALAQELRVPLWLRVANLEKPEPTA